MSEVRVGRIQGSEARIKGGVGRRQEPEVRGGDDFIEHSQFEVLLLTLLRYLVYFNCYVVV